MICASGHRSLAAAEFLGQRGIDARSVADGTKGWISRGLPVVYGDMTRGLLVTAAYIAVFGSLAWARLTTKDISS